MLESALSAVTTCESSDQRSDQSKDSTTWIYFLGVNNDERIKIGESSKPRGARRKQHERGSLGTRNTIDELCELRGHVSDEKAIQRYFYNIRWPSEKEVFRPEPELIEYIRWLRDRWFVVVPETSDAEREAMPAVESSEWLPSADRRKPPAQGTLPGIGGPFDLGYRQTTGDDFYTSPIILDSARRTMGRIDLDPASHAVANREVKASRFFTRGDNGLAQRWSGKVWLNPPFSCWSEWVSKVLAEWASGDVDEMCVLSAMRTVTAQYFARLLQTADAMCIIRGRIKFWGGVAGDSPDDGHAIFYFGKNR